MVDDRYDPLKDAREDRAAASALRMHSLVFRNYQIKLARLLARIETAKHHRLAGCSNVADYAARFGLSPGQARSLARVGHAIEMDGRLIHAMRVGRLNVEHVVALWRVWTAPKRPKDDDVHWVAIACHMSSVDFAQVVSYHLEKWRTGKDPVQIEMWIDSDALAAFRRAKQVIARRNEIQDLSDGQAVGILSESYLDRFDEDRQVGRPRRAGDTSFIPDSRYIPAAVRRAVWAREHGRCAVPGCHQWRDLQYAHVIPHRHGGNREIGNILLLCRFHNMLMETGHLKIIGTAEDPIFVDNDGKVHVPFAIWESDRPTVDEWRAHRDAWLKKLDDVRSAPSVTHSRILRLVHRVEGLPGREEVLRSIEERATTGRGWT